MKKFRFLQNISTSMLLMLLTLALLSPPAMAQKTLPAPQKTIEYKIKQSEGTNASAVAWHAKLKIYVCIIAGNKDYPLEGFDQYGRAKFQLKAGQDFRGLWYNPSTKKMEMNLAGSDGWKAFKLNSDFSKEPSEVIFAGQLQPDFQSVGTYDYVKSQVVFHEGGKLFLYSRKNLQNVSSVALVLDGMNLEAFNNTVGFTGKKGFEFVMLNHKDKKLYFFNREGKYTANASLPQDAPTYESFAFSFANGHAFLYDKSDRIWYGYKVF